MRGVDSTSGFFFVPYVLILGVGSIARAGGVDAEGEGGRGKDRPLVSLNYVRVLLGAERFQLLCSFVCLIPGEEGGAL